MAPTHAYQFIQTWSLRDPPVIFVEDITVVGTEFKSRIIFGGRSDVLGGGFGASRFFQIAVFTPT